MGDIVVIGGIAGCNCLCFVITWITFLTMSMSANTEMEAIKLPELNSFSHDWSTPLISGLYRVDKYSQCAEEDGPPILNLVWPGSLDICFGEEVSFYKKERILIYDTNINGGIAAAN